MAFLTAEVTGQTLSGCCWGSFCGIETIRVRVVVVFRDEVAELLSTDLSTRSDKDLGGVGVGVSSPMHDLAQVRRIVYYTLGKEMIPG